MKKPSKKTLIKVFLVLLCCVAISFLLGWNSANRTVSKREVTASSSNGNIHFPSRSKVDKPNLNSTAKTQLPNAFQRPRPWVVLASTNNAFLDFTQNWLQSLRKCGITNHVTVVAEDAAARDFLANEKGVDLDVRLTSTTNLPGEFLQFGSEDYLRLVNKRPAYILSYLKRGVDVLFSDVDTVWLQNPLPFFVGDYDVHFERDIYGDPKKPDMICAGFAYYTATNATIDLVKRWIHLIERRPEIPDQQLLNQLLRNRTILDTLRINFLDQRQFPNGRDYFDKEWRQQNADVRPVVVHNNWIKGHDIKIERFKNVSMWYL